MEGQEGERSGEHHLVTWRRAVEASTVGAVFYAYGWIVLASTLGRFDVAPEEVGVGFAYLTVRAAIMVAAVAPLAGGCAAVLRHVKAHDLEVSLPARLTGRERTWAEAVLVVVGLLVFTLVFGRLASTVVAVTCALVGVALGAGIVTVQEAAGEQGRVVSLTRAVRAAAWALLLAAVVAVVVAPFVAGDRFADRIEAGEEVSPPILPGVPGLTVRSVEVTSLTPEHRLPGSGCVLLLGSAGGVSVVYDPVDDAVHRLPDEQVVITSPCPGGP